MPDPEKPEETTTVDLNDPAIKAAFDEAVASQVTGLKTNRDTILTEKKALADELTALKAKWGDLDAEKVQGLIAQFEKSEEAKMIAEGKIEDVLNLRTEAMRKDAESRVTAATTKLEEMGGLLAKKDAVIASLVIDASVDDAARGLECTASAHSDIRRAAREVFSLDEEHNPVARSADGTFLVGKNGKDPLTPAEWLETQKDTSPHWWGTSAGGGASGGGIVTGDGSRLSPEQLNNMSAQQKMVHAMRGDKISRR